MKSQTIATQTDGFEPLPPWLIPTWERLSALHLATDQHRAAWLLLTALERDQLPTPEVKLSSVSVGSNPCNRRTVAALGWLPKTQGGRGLIVTPFDDAGRLRVEFVVYDGPGVLWFGRPADPVPFARSALVWILDGAAS